MAVLVLDAEAVSALPRPHRILAAINVCGPRCAARTAATPRYASLPPFSSSCTAATAVTKQSTPYSPRGFAQVVTSGIRKARIAGHLLAEAGAGSEMAIDALVVATAIRFGGGIVATHDPDDLRLLAARRPNVAILDI